jgi:hypothetical protein
VVLSPAVHTIGFCLFSFSFTSDWVASAATGELANVSEPILFSARLPSAPLQWEMQNPFADMPAELERIAKKPVIRADGVSGLDAAQFFDLHVSAGSTVSGVASGCSSSAGWSTKSMDNITALDDAAVAARMTSPKAALAHWLVIIRLSRRGARHLLTVALVNGCVGPV